MRHIFIAFGGDGEHDIGFENHYQIMKELYVIVYIPDKQNIHTSGYRRIQRSTTPADQMTTTQWEKKVQENHRKKRLTSLIAAHNVLLCCTNSTLLKL